MACNGENSYVEVSAAGAAEPAPASKCTEETKYEDEEGAVGGISTSADDVEDAACPSVPLLSTPLSSDLGGSTPQVFNPNSLSSTTTSMSLLDVHTGTCLSKGLQPHCGGEFPELYDSHTGDSFLTLDGRLMYESSLNMPSCSYDTKSNMSETNAPICRICHNSGDNGADILISPCRCSGTLEFIHNTCLMRWLEVSSKKSRKPPKCELCHFQYHRHKKFKLHHFRVPRVSRQDKILHCIFLVMLVIMIGCAIATIMCFLSDKGQISKFPRNKEVDLATEEIITLSCGILFFVSFFVAMSVEIKAKHTVYQLFVKFIMQNMEWEIDQYDKDKDSLYHKAVPPAYV